MGLNVLNHNIMQIITSTAELFNICHKWQMEGESIALVPTMGYYHKGHENLMTIGRKEGTKLVVSLFVNPSQFGPNEDLSQYPKDYDRDFAIAESHGTDLIFVPDPNQMYKDDHATWVEVPDLAKNLCGKSRPIHFRGVCTVVLKLFMLIKPNIAIFGEKDWQQQAIIKRMVRDLNIPVFIKTGPLIREDDGLALSSRNIYLSTEQRVQAPHIYKGLLKAYECVEKGEKISRMVKENVLCYWAKYLPLGRLDYLSIIHPETLEELDSIDGPARIACAIRLGKARLLDNILLHA